MGEIIARNMSSWSILLIQLLLLHLVGCLYYCINPLTANDHYFGRTAPLTSKRCILYIYSTNTGTECFKHGIYSSFFFSSKCSLFHNSNVFGSCIIQILYTGCAKIKKKNNSGAKRLNLSNFTTKRRAWFASEQYVIVQLIEWHWSIPWFMQFRRWTLMWV